MPNRLPVLGLLALACFAFPMPLAAATSARVLSSDARGLTVRLDVPAWHLAPAGSNGLQRLVVPGFEVTDVPGRAGMPFASVLIALPPATRASARVEAEGAWEDLGKVRLETAGKPEFEGDEARGLEPVRTPVAAIEDGPWPRASVEVGEPFSLRRQRMVAVLLRPFRWDATSGALTGTRSVTVRVDFVGGAASSLQSAGPTEEDRHWEPVLKSAVLNYEQARGWRSRPTRAVRSNAGSLLGPRGAAAARVVAEGDYPEVRVKLDSTGVYELSYPELEAKGYPANIPISQVSVHRHEFVEGANPPFVSIELPIEVEDGDGSGTFNEGDRIFVFVQSWAERARASWAQRMWGDAEVVYATAVNGAGLRLPTRPGWRNVTGLTPLASYPWRQRWERNFNYYLFPPDTLTDQFQWTEIELYYIRPDTLRFETNQLDTSKTATITANWIGRRSGPHFSWARYHKPGAPFITVADSVFWFGTGAQTVTATNPGSTLGEGVNTMAVWGKGANGPPDPLVNSSDYVGFNWIEATYWRRFQALNQILSCNSADASGEVQFLATGFSYAAIHVYDVTDSLNPVALDIDPSHVNLNAGAFEIEFQDSVASGQTKRYVVFSQPKILPAEDYTAVTRRQLTNRSGADYLLVVPEAFLAAVGPLVTLRQSQGLNVMVAPFESVCDEFNGGRTSDYAIKRLVRYAYDNWNAKFLLLFGDGSEDPQNFMNESSPDRIPVHKINGPVAITFGYEIIPSDPWYVCMENCDLGSFMPVLQDLFVGRLPVQSLPQAQGVVTKLVNYENFASDQTWRQSILLCDDDAFSAETFFGGGGTQLGYCYRPGEVVFRQINETVASVIHDDAGLQQAVLDTFHLDTKLAGRACHPSSPDCSCKDQATAQQITHGSITPDLITHLNAGRLWWNFQGHANEFVLAHEDLYVNRGSEDDKDLLMNDGKLFLFSAFSCHANAFARFADQASGRGPTLGEEMVTLPSRGAIGSWASTGYEILPFSGSSHINVSWARAMFEDPPHDTYLGDNGARVVLGESIALALARYVPTVTFNPNEKGIALTYHLLGDPGTRLSIGPPEAVVTANGEPVINDQPVALAPPRDTLHLEADLVSNVQIRSIALLELSASGTRAVPDTSYTLTPAFPDTGVGGLGGRRYHLSYTAPLRPGVLRYTLRTTDRYGVASDFNVVLPFFTILRYSGNPMAENDAAVPTASLSLKVVLPTPIADPQTEFKLEVADTTVIFRATQLDLIGRTWLLEWDHEPYGLGIHAVEFTALDSLTSTHRFRVVDAAGTGARLLRDVLAFPNPFEDEIGTSFSIYLLSQGPADVLLQVFTIRGRLISQREERGLLPGAHELVWQGRDAEGDKLANGVYLYRVLATADGRSDTFQGRLVKLRKPRRVSTP